MNLPKKISDRIVKADSGCWLWIGYVAQNGYGKFTYNRRTYCAHRVVYELLVGPIQKGMQIDHLCRVRNCVNPDHLEQVTQKENIMRGESFAAKNSTKTTCIRGHEFIPALPGMITNGVRRCCKVCSRLRAAQHYERVKNGQR